jgi:hypothetical protein
VGRESELGRGEGIRPAGKKRKERKVGPDWAAGKRRKKKKEIGLGWS